MVSDSVKGFRILNNFFTNAELEWVNNDIYYILISKKYVKRGDRWDYVKKKKQKFKKWTLVLQHYLPLLLNHPNKQWVCSGFLLCSQLNNPQKINATVWHNRLTDQFNSTSWGFPSTEGREAQPFPRQGVTYRLKSLACGGSSSLVWWWVRSGSSLSSFTAGTLKEHQPDFPMQFHFLAAPTKPLRRLGGSSSSHTNSYGSSLLSQPLSCQYWLHKA